MVAHNKVVINGSFAGGEEQWSIGINMMGRTSSADLITDQTSLNDFADAIHGNLEDDLSLVRNLLTTNGGFSSTVTQYYGPDNVLALQSIPSANYIAGLGAPNCPLQTAVVASLQTGVPGASFRGRIYLPGPGAAIDGDFRLTTPTEPADLAPQLATWLEALNTYSLVASGDLVPCVFSPTRDLVTPVTAVRVGDVADTQRRRRDSLIENYSTASVG